MAFGKAVWATASGQTVLGSVDDDMLGGYWAGATALSGGAGNDSYYIYNAQNTIVENVNEGTDEVITTFSYTLGDNLENLTLAANDIWGVGNGLNNVIAGQDGHQTLFGAGGNDILMGGAGADTFIAKAGNGSDTITDFAGSDGDMVRLGSYGFTSFASVVSAMTQQGSNVVLKLSATENLTFNNTVVSAFAADDFQYALNTANLSLSFSDDFNGLSLQSAGGVWKTWLPGSGGTRALGSTSGELQAYVDSDFQGVNPFSVSNGQLTIHADKASAAVKAATGRDYTSGLLTTRDAFSQTYGYFEIKCQLPSGQGTWPAFWLLPADGSWPPELDVMEQLGSDTSTIYTTAHSSNGGHTQTGISSWAGDTSAGMHTYGVLWTAQQLVWYVDGAEVFRTATPSDMNKPMYMVTNLAIGGWAGTPGASFSGADMVIDYIKAYSLTSTAPETGKDATTTTADVTTLLASGVLTLVLTGVAAIDGTGNGLDNTLSGNGGDNRLYGLDGADTLNGGDGNDWLDGGASVDLMNGGAGNDTYIVDAATDRVIEVAGEGTDVVQASVSYGLGEAVESLVLTGTSAINGTGNALNNCLTGNLARNVLTGGDGNDTIDGGGGGDSLVGGDGNDTYIIRSTGDFITETAGGGNDAAFSAITYAIAANVESLALTGSADINGTGNVQDNTLTGNSGNNALYGGDGNDRLVGAAGNDSLTGGTGDDTMLGGSGDDAYYVDAAGDVISEAAGEGTDWVYTSVSYTLSDNLEKLTLQGTANINGTGNALDNVLNGNSGNNVLTGGGGNDTFWGGAGTDTMIGGSGNDVYYADAYGDVVTEAANGGTDTVYATTSYVLSDNIENLTLQGTADYSGTGNGLSNNLNGNGGNNWLSGGAGNDNIYGGLGNDTMLGGTGNDTFYVDAAGDVVTEYANEGTDTVYATVSCTIGNNIENLTLQGSDNINGTGNSGDNSLTGNAGNNLLTGGGGNDNFWGGLGNDTMVGGAGNDTYYADVAGDVVTEAANGGTDVVYATVSYTLSDNVENLTLTGSDNLNGTGNALNNSLTGNAGANKLSGGAGNDSLWGGLGNDTMLGGAGNDTFYVDATGDVVTEYANEGADTVYATATFTIGDNIENLTLTGSDNINGIGNTLDNNLTGNAGNNQLTGGGGNDNFWGGLGNDTMVGGTGNDTYYVDASGDVVTEAANGGTDIVYSTVTYSLGDNIEKLTLQGTDAINGTGNGLDNAINGNAGNNRLSGGAGADTLTGGAGNDTMLGGAGNDTYYVDATGDVVTEAAGEGTDTVFASASFTIGDNVENLTLTGSDNISGTGNSGDNSLTGNNGNNLLTGGGGNDTFWGGLGNDTMIGGSGNDLYYVDATGDVVTEAANGGTDIVYATASWTLSDNIENLTLTGSADIAGYGNTLNNNLTGNAGNNYLFGGGGNDNFWGGLGNDTMVGGAGNDTYYVDASGDVVTEAADGGTDLVYAAVSHSLGANIENLTLTGTADLSATGNALGNNLTGNAGANWLSGGDGNDVLWGGAGADAMLGGFGNDSFYVDNGGDVVVEAAGEGMDVVYASASFTLGDNVENLTLQGSAAINGTGNSLDNALSGNGADNWLTGGAGADTLYGGAGSDTFVFDQAPGAGVDRIWDFVHGVDHLALSGAVFGLMAGALDEAAFYAGTKAHDADDRLFYNASNGNLYFDADGNGSGAAVLVAQLSTNLGLTASDFMII